jgi:hypothetical protein
VFFLAFAILVSRGFLELYAGKNAAYALQILAVAGFTACLVIFGKPHLRSDRKWVAAFAYGFLLVALLSAWASLQFQGIDYFASYLIVVIFYVALLVVYTLFDFEAARRIAVGPVLVLVGGLLVGIALAQQFLNLNVLPGSDLFTFGTMARPSSLTGSFLHYPIVGALMVFLLMGIGAQRKKRFYYLAAGIVAFGVAASLSRSGIVILIVGAIVALIVTRGIGARFRVLATLSLSVAIVMFVFPTGQFLERLTSIFDTEGSGNNVRVDLWGSVVDLWLYSPLLIGWHTGQYTNVTANVSGAAGGVAESGVLQMLVSFGLLGMIAYYGLMIGIVSVLPSVPPWFVAGAVAGIAQSAVYQSIEVMPFMVLFAWFPLIASANARSNPSIPW